MAQFEQLQELWRTQPQPRARAFDPDLTAAGFRRYGRRQDWINLAKLAVVVAVLAWSAYMTRSPWFRAGMAWIGSGAVLMIALDWRKQRRIAGLDFSSPSLAFVQKAYAGLLAQRSPFQSQYWIFLVTMLGGINMMFLGDAYAAGRPPRLSIHLAASAMTLAAFGLGLFIRRKRFDAECRPLLHQLASLRASLEEANL